MAESRRALAPRIGLFVAIVLAYLTSLSYRNHWKVVELNKADFELTDGANYTIIPVPTTFYKTGKLAEKLPQWHHDFHLYRLEDGEPSFNFDHSKIESSVRAKALRDNCKWESALCTPCFDPEKKVTNVNISTIYKESGWYASFAKISTEVVTELWDMFNFPFSVDITSIEHAFISNLKESMITASIHANPMTSSMAIQFTGYKTWIFFPPDVYRGKDGLAAIPAAPILLPRKAPSKPYNIYIYHARPGDVLFFSEAWAHMVYTYKGPNFMVNYRHMQLGNILRQPITWLTAAFNMRVFAKILHTAGKSGAGQVQDEAVPEKALNLEVYKKLDTLCNGGITPFDQQMLDLIKKNMLKFN